MNAVGIISEYNPFHAGHSYHIRQAKQLSGADYAVILMNGDFMQRGEPAVFDKYKRTRLALEGGADLVFELPVRFGISSAGDFALGGVLALESLGFVGSLCFGSESGDLAVMQEAAAYLYEEPGQYREQLGSALRQGMSFPAARAHALSVSAGLDTDMLKQPNHILAIEYCLALRRLSSPIKPLTIVRAGQGYHDPGQPEKDEFPSAASIRTKIIQEGSVNYLCLDDLSSAIGHALLTTGDLCAVKDVTPDLADRIRRFLPEYTDADTLVGKCLNPSVTAGRIRRCLLQCLIGLHDTEPSMPYLRLLGLRKEASSLLSHRENASCRILSRLAPDKKNLPAQAVSLLNQDLLASDLYRQTWCRKYKTVLPNEYQHSPVIL